MRVSMPMRPAILVSLLLAAVSVLCPAQSSNLDVNQIVSRMAQVRAAERGHSPAYTVTRDYQLSSAGASQPTSEVLAEISFVPPGQKDFVIVKSQGSDRGTGIVHRILEHEASMASHWQPYELSSANYDFALLGREAIAGHDCYVLQLSPKRQAAELVRGKAWVDAQEFQVRRIEGETAKSPSFWIKNVQVSISYDAINGVWLETSTRATADVRVAGPHVLTSRELDVRTATFDARAKQPAAPNSNVQRRNRQRLAADTATWVAR